MLFSSSRLVPKASSLAHHAFHQEPMTYKHPSYESLQKAQKQKTIKAYAV